MDIVVVLFSQLLFTSSRMNFQSQPFKPTLMRSPENAQKENKFHNWTTPAPEQLLHGPCGEIVL